MTNEFFSNESVAYVPEEDPLFVAFGVFKPLKEILESRMFFPTYITGLSGNGKTYTALQVCAQLKREAVRVNITEETDEDSLLGGFRLIDGNTVFVKGPVVNAMERGAILILDEVDLADPAKIMCLQPILEGNPVFLKKNGETVKPKKGFNIVATANTKGKGNLEGQFISTKVQNEANLDRYAITLEQNYPKDSVETVILEKAFDDCGLFKTDDRDKIITAMVKWASKIRDNFTKDVHDEVVTTRRLVNIVKGFSIFGDIDKAVKYSCQRFDVETADSFIELFGTYYEASMKGEESDNEMKLTKEEVDEAIESLKANDFYAWQSTNS